MRSSQLQFNLVKRILSIVLPLAIVALLLTQISIGDITSLVENVRIEWIALGMCFYLIVNVFRAFRVRALLPQQKTDLSNLLAVMVVQSMFNNILPARIGELSLVYLLYKHEHIALDVATVVLLVARLFDYLAVALLFVVAAGLSINNLPPETANVIWISLALMIIVAGVLLSIVWLGKRSVQIAERLCLHLGLEHNKLAENGLRIIRRVVQAFELIYSARILVAAFGWSLMIWIFTFTWFFAFLKSISINVQPNNLVVGATFAILSKAIPFISIGGLGAHEAGWTVGFMLVGYEKTIAILSGFAVNILTTISSVVLGLFALVWLNKKSKPSLPDSVVTDFLQESDQQ